MAPRTSDLFGSRPKAGSAPRRRRLGLCILIVVADGLSASAIETKRRAAGAGHRRAVFGTAALHGSPCSGIAGAGRARRSHRGGRGRADLHHDRWGAARLSAADSVGVYVTCSPRPGTPDSRRNCISNIRAGGLAIDRAAEGVASLVEGMLITGISGVGLIDALERPTPEQLDRLAAAVDAVTRAQSLGDSDASEEHGP